MTRNPVARHLADARNRRRIVPDKRREELEREDRAAMATNHCCLDAMECQSDGYGYLVRLLHDCAPTVAPSSDMLGICTQIDNVIEGYRIRQGELPEQATASEITEKP